MTANFSYVHRHELSWSTNHDKPCADGGWGWGRVYGIDGFFSSGPALPLVLACGDWQTRHFFRFSRYTRFVLYIYSSLARYLHRYQYEIHLGHLTFPLHEVHLQSLLPLSAVPRLPKGAGIPTPPPSPFVQHSLPRFPFLSSRKDWSYHPISILTSLRPKADGQHLNVTRRLT